MFTRFLINVLFISGHQDESFPLNENPLHFAALGGNIAILQLLLTPNKTKINCKDSEGNTALIYAIKHNHEQTARWLVKQGADIHAANQWLLQPIHYASWKGMSQLLSLLIKKGADITAQSERFGSPLHSACHEGGSLECIKTLIKKNAPLNSKNNKGQTPLHVCVKFHSAKLEVILELIAAGALMNETDNEGNTPLHLALLTRSSGVINTLITHGARTDIPNNAGQTALKLLEARRQS